MRQEVSGWPNRSRSKFPVPATPTVNINRSTLRTNYPVRRSSPPPIHGAAPTAALAARAGGPPRTRPAHGAGNRITPDPRLARSAEREILSCH
eukprot:5014303-Prymnesium_polylepis.1